MRFFAQVTYDDERSADYSTEPLVPGRTAARVKNCTCPQESQT